LENPRLVASNLDGRTRCANQEAPFLLSALKESADYDAHDALTWRWGAGAATTGLDFGDPVGANT